MKRTLKRGLIIGAAGTAFSFLGHHLLTRKMMRIAMDRVEPQERDKGKERLAGSPELIKITEMIEAAASRLENSGCEQVQINGCDGVSLVGHWYPCDAPKRIIVAMHGWRSSWAKDFGLIVDFWHNYNCAVLFAEQRGQNNSGGDHMSFGLLERFDCLDWVKWVNKRMGMSLPVYLAGVSMGATSVLMASELELPDNVYGIAADSAFTSPHAIWKHVSENNLHIPYALHKGGADRMCQQRIHMEAGAASTIEALKHCKVPVFLAHGTDDHFVPVEMTYENYKACPSEKRLLIVPGADHCMSYLMEKETYERTAKEFWETCEQLKRI